LIVAKAGARYPQVELTAAGLAGQRVATAPRNLCVEAALALARHAHAEVVIVGPRSAVRRPELVRAIAWGLGARPVEAVAWRDLPVVPATAGEITVRRLALAGAPMIVVREGRRAVGAIDSERLALARPALSLGRQLGAFESGSGAAALCVCRVAGRMGERLGLRVCAVGGFVRDVLLDRVPPDVDLLVEGDGVEFARRLVDEIGGRLTSHPGFGTASIEREGRDRPERVDIASARREHYERPGALPAVRPASIDEDLRRRDFSVNAMAMTLSPADFGGLLDPLGGHRDLVRRRLRPLSPLSFAEDPTRIFRAARYAARLGFRLDSHGSRALALALAIGRFPALSGQRLRAELELLAAEPSGWRGLEHLVRWGALALLDHAYRRGADTVRRLRAAARLCAWAEREEVDLDRSRVALIALLAGQEPLVISRCLERLALTGEPLRALRAGATTTLARRLDRGTRWRRSQVAALLDACPVEVLVGSWLRGGRRARHLIEWFLAAGRATRPALSGDEVVALGVARGPEVGVCLAALRRRRLDRQVRTLADEREFVRAWLAGRAQRREERRAV
jgi:tRNA nucleotidyltransferase (CCA-adding enzyme)